MAEAEPPAVVDLGQAKLKAADALTYASALVVDNHEAWSRARQIRSGIKVLDSGLDKHFKKMKRPWDEGKKKILDEEKEYRAAIGDALGLLDPKILSYEEELERERENLRRVLQEEARQNAETERLAKAAELERDGDHEAARRLLEQPLYTPPVIVPDIYKELFPGEGRNETWGVEEETIDIMALARAVVDGTQPANVLLPNTTALNAMAKALKDTFNVPGCKARRRRGITQKSS